jgi:hypothetical protein
MFKRFKAAFKAWWRRNIIADGWQDEKGFHFKDK